jgi:hypothetical protein
LMAASMNSMKIVDSPALLEALIAS